MRNIQTLNRVYLFLSFLPASAGPNMTCFHCQTIKAGHSTQKSKPLGKLINAYQ